MALSRRLANWRAGTLAARGGPEQWLRPYTTARPGTGQSLLPYTTGSNQMRGFQKSGGSGFAVGRQRFEKQFARFLELFFEPLRAVAATAGPRFRSILIAAFAPVVCVLYPDKIKILLPVRTLLLQRRRAV